MQVQCYIEKKGTIVYEEMTISAGQSAVWLQQQDSYGGAESADAKNHIKTVFNSFLFGKTLDTMGILQEIKLYIPKYTYIELLYIYI